MTRFLVGLITASLFVITPLRADDKPVKVFILAGQSNMEGKAPNTLLDHQATDAKTRDLFAHLRKDDKWVERDDVFIKFLERKGPLTVGYGSPGRTGPELEFGTVMGNHFEEPVILVKAAEELFPTWKQNTEQWKLVGGDFPYHYLGSAIWFNRIGQNMGESMLELRRGSLR